METLRAKALAMRPPWWRRSPLAWAALALVVILLLSMTIGLSASPREPLLPSAAKAPSLGSAPAPLRD